MKNQQAHNHLTKARTALLLDHYFFGRLALYLKLVEDPSLPTLAVDGKHIWYNPEFCLTLSSELMKSAIVHEIMHCVYEHQLRRGGREPRLWNVAGDYVINAAIKKSGFVLGKGWLYEKAFEGMTSEHIYDLLKQENDGKGPSNAGNGPSDGGALDEIRDGGGSQAEMVEQQIEWKIAVSQAAHGAKQNGKMPAGMERFIEELGTPKVPWREVLQRFITQVNKDDYAWSRPNKKFAHYGTWVPSLYSEAMGEIVVAIDTSGSIDQPTLNAFGDEIRAIVAATRPEKTTVIYCDSAVNHVDTFMPNDELAFKLHGGGGTDFCPPFRHVEQNELNPVAFVYLTDMMGRFPAEPEYPVLWCATTDIAGPFGETIRIEV